MEYQLQKLVYKLPKVDLHRHLEGSIRPKTLLEIAKQNKITLPTYNLSKLTSLITFSKPKPSLKKFVKPLETVVRCFCNKEAIERVTYEVIEDAYRDNVRYLELTLSLAFVESAHKLPLHTVLDSLLDGVKSAEKKFPVKAALIVGIAPLWKEHKWSSPDEIFDAVSSFKDTAIVGIGLCSELKDGTPLFVAKKDVWHNFVQISKKAKDEGLFVHVHAGEVGKTECVKVAIEDLSADRIGHGINVVQDSRILRLVLERRIPLEICLTSNIMSGVVSSIREHPFKRLYDMSAVVTLNTDDPSLCQITLTSEYMLAMNALQLSLADIRKIILSGISASFLSHQEKEQMAESRTFDTLCRCLKRYE